MSVRFTRTVHEAVIAIKCIYGYFMVDIKSLICADMGHFRRFEFRKGSVATVNGKNGNANGEK